MGSRNAGPEIRRQAAPEGVGDHAGSRGDHARPVLTPARQKRDANRRPVGESGSRRRWWTRLGCPSYAPPRTPRENASDAVRAGPAPAHHVQQEPAALRFKRVAGVDEAQQAEHSNRRARVPDVSQIPARAEQLGDRTVYSDAGKAMRAQPWSTGAGPPSIEISKSVAVLSLRVIIATMSVPARASA